MSFMREANSNTFQIFWACTQDWPSFVEVFLRVLRRLFIHKREFRHLSSIGLFLHGKYAFFSFLKLFEASPIIID